jgi:hypothetical protein
MSKILNLVDLNQTEMQRLKSGCVWDPSGCQCACAYENEGGSSSFANWEANNAGGLVSPECDD